MKSFLLLFWCCAGFTLSLLIFSFFPVLSSLFTLLPFFFVSPIFDVYFCFYCRAAACNQEVRIYPSTIAKQYLQNQGVLDACQSRNGDWLCEDLNDKK